MASSTETPIATYQEQLPQVRRAFRLFKDRVEIDATWTLGRSYQTIVKLADLSPQPKQFQIRNRWFKRAVMVASLAVAAALVFTREGYAPLMRRVAGIGWLVAGMAIVVAVFTFRKRQFLHFPRKDGRPGLDICRTRSETFENFLKEVQTRIR